MRRCQTAGVFGAVRKRGAEEAGAVMVKVATLDGNAMLYVPAPQTVYDAERGGIAAVHGAADGL